MKFTTRSFTSRFLLGIIISTAGVLLTNQRVGIWTWYKTNSTRVKPQLSHDDHWHIDTPSFE
jgi:hypothetical protein